MDTTDSLFLDHPAVQKVTPLSTFKWLKQGYFAFKRAPAYVLFYGMVFFAVSYGINYCLSAPPVIVITLSTILFLVGPLLAIGLYDIAKQLEGPSHLSLWHSIVAWHVNIQGFSLYIVLLITLVFTWFCLSLLVFKLGYDIIGLASLEHIMEYALDQSNIDFLCVYFGIGSLFAVVIFASSFVALPMLLDKKEIDITTVIITSMQAVLQNAVTMLLWVVIVVSLYAISFLTYYFGFIITLPLVGLATWYAYQDLVSYSSQGGTVEKIYAE